MASQALQRQQAYGVIHAEMHKDQVFSALTVAMPRLPGSSIEAHVARAQRARRVAMQLIRGSTRLQESTPESIVGSVLQACQLGLELDGVLGQAYLVPYRDRKSGRTVCQMQVGYRGFETLALRSGLVIAIHAEVVQEADTVVFSRGTSAYLDHQFDPSLEDRGALKWSYAVAQLPGGGSQFAIADRARIAAAERASKSGDSGPWKLYPRAMWRKTAIRELGKDLPQCPEMMRAAVHDEYVEEGHAPVQPTVDEVLDECPAEAEEVECHE